jgi:phosphatidylglycerol:prolipoprotein diacylglycerol transferase
MLVAGFLGGHMLDQIFYHWPEFVKRPWSIFLLYEGLSSFGGFIGAFIGITLWKYFEAVQGPTIPVLGFSLPKYKKRELAMPILPFADLILSVFPVAWVFGRSGCSSVHDHPGMKAEPGTLLAVSFPDRNAIYALQKVQSIEFVHGGYPQFDLGLLELLFTIILASLLALTWHKKLATGSYVVATAVCYAPVRFAMDFLRVRDVDQADPRFGGLTPAQWMCVALFLFGLYIARKVQQIKASGKDPQDMVALPGGAPPLASRASP